MATSRIKVLCTSTCRLLVLVVLRQGESAGYKQDTSACVCKQGGNYLI